MISKKQFQEYVDQGFTIIPLSKEISLEGASPLSIYSKIANKTNTFLLESNQISFTSITCEVTEFPS